MKKLVNFKLEQLIIDKMDEISKKTGITKTAIVRQALEAHLSKLEKLKI